jgi:hypothetical protein
MFRVVMSTFVAAAMGLAGIYGLLMAFVAACEELARSWRHFSLWCSGLAQGILNAPPPAIWATWFDAELTWLLSSVVPLILLGLGVYLCRETLRPFVPSGRV